MVKLLLDTGKIAIDSKNNDGRTPLWWAIIQKHETMVKLLLDTGKVAINSKNNNDRTPL
jgi:ankyrin repeat protein